MEKLFNSFANFLCCLGIIDNDDSLLTLKKTFNERILDTKKTNKFINNSEKDWFIDSMCYSLLLYINCLPIETKKKIIKNSIQNYLKYKEKKLKISIMLCERINKNSKNVKYYFNIWQNKVNNKKSKFNRYKNIYKSKSNKNNLSLHLTKSSNDNCIYQLNNFNKKINIEKSWEKIERESFEKCTFHPKINKVDDNNNKLFNIYDKLYSDSEKYKMKKDIEKMDYDRFNNINNTFTPQTTNSINAKNYKNRTRLFKSNLKTNYSFTDINNNNNNKNNCNKIENYYFKNPNEDNRNLNNQIIEQKNNYENMDSNFSICNIKSSDIQSLVNSPKLDNSEKIKGINYNKDQIKKLYELYKGKNNNCLIDKKDNGICQNLKGANCHSYSKSNSNIYEINNLNKNDSINLKNIKNKIPINKKKNINKQFVEKMYNRYIEKNTINAKKEKHDNALYKKNKSVTLNSDLNNIYNYNNNHINYASPQYNFTDLDNMTNYNTCENNVPYNYNQNISKYKYKENGQFYNYNNTKI